MPTVRFISPSNTNPNRALRALAAAFSATAVQPRGVPLDPEKVRAEAKEIFLKADLDSDRQLTKSEMKKYFQAERGMLERLLRVEMPWKEVFAELDAYDTDKDGHVNEEEFVSFYLSKMIRCASHIRACIAWAWNVDQSQRLSIIIEN